MPGGVLENLAVIFGTVATLVFLEGLLSADNALVLAVMVRHLPKDQQKRALRYGIWGAFGFRAIGVGLSALLLRFWIFKVIGGLYLLYLALRHFLWDGGDHGAEDGKPGAGFWRTVVSVELADIAFSIDSILAAVALADGIPPRFGPNWKLGIVYVGGILGIITMRFVAGYFIILLDKFAGLETGAYALVAWIGLKLVGGGLHDWRNELPTTMPEWLFWSGMGAIVVASMLWKPPASGPGKKKASETEGLAQVVKTAQGEDSQI